MAASVPNAKIQVGGGIRSMSTVEICSMPASSVSSWERQPCRITIRPKALADHPNNIAIGIDARDGKVQVSGWTEDSHIGAIDSRPAPSGSRAPGS
jgi:phosphoribosylformimino-5-aminoimidazole carboxamide ribotide isomerase